MKLFEHILKMSEKSFSNEKIIYKTEITDCNKPTRKGKYITFQSGLSSVTFFVGINPTDNKQILFSEFVN